MSNDANIWSAVNGPLIQVKLSVNINHVSSCWNIKGYNNSSNVFDNNQYLLPYTKVKLYPIYFLHSKVRRKMQNYKRNKILSNLVSL